MFLLSCAFGVYGTVRGLDDVVSSEEDAQFAMLTNACCLVIFLIIVLVMAVLLPENAQPAKLIMVASKPFSFGSSSSCFYYHAAFLSMAE